ncbi:MAG: hypothetical protein GXP53_01140 [Deltaproteobacteria bacterium]|nr:hypothetical protein [Deltaproteobacteria bacterium]
MDEKNKKKLPYERPRLKVIELVADEVLAIGCKLAGVGQAAFGNAAFNQCTLPRRCYNPGS